MILQNIIKKKKHRCLCRRTDIHTEGVYRKYHTAQLFQEQNLYLIQDFQCRE
jgi:hypothetical protein